MRKYRLTVDENQASLIYRALEFYMRVGGLGQFGEVLDHWRFRCVDTEIEPAKAALDRAHVCLVGLPVNANPGIHSPQVPDEYRAAYDLEQVIRHRLAWDRNPEGGFQVWFDKPHLTGPGPLAKIEAVEGD